MAKVGRKSKDGTRISLILDNELLRTITAYSKFTGISKTQILEDGFVMWKDKYTEILVQLAQRRGMTLEDLLAEYTKE